MDSNHDKMQSEVKTCSRRSILTGSAALLIGGALGGVMTGAAATASAKPRKTASEAPPLPWKWARLDPLEAGRRAYRYYATGGCGHAAYMAFISLLREKVGYPWTTLPDRMMVHAGGGYGGHGTLCGALGGTSCIINLVTDRVNDPSCKQMIDQLFFWYTRQEFPTDRFDDISPIARQVRVRAMSPLCHTSVSKWTRKAGVQVTSSGKKERCAKVSGEVVYITTLALNDYFDGKWTPGVWTPSRETEHCMECHGPDDMFHTEVSLNQQQGHMECLMCHTDHTE